eukprot:m.285939 g.285939  ORF g.285939 m.285939 type:complete len:384 (-) comp19919_c0_seq1:117-1268(-)
MSAVSPENIGNVKVSEHLDLLRTHIVSHEFEKVEKVLSNFWSRIPLNERDVLAQPDALLATKMIYRAFYERMIHSMIPDVFRPMSHAVTKSIRSFAKQSERWTRSALDSFPEPFVTVQVDVAIAFAQKIRRYTGLNHLVQAARAVLANPLHIQQMQEDYSKVDFAAAEEQLIQTCEGCPRDVISRHEAKFREFHRSSSCKIMEWATWMQGIVAESMGVFDNAMAYEERGGNLLLRWSFMSSMIIRDLTLRSAASFGPFHLMRLLCDEYMYFLVESALQRRECVPFVHEAEPATPADNTDNTDGDVNMESSSGASAPSSSAATAPDSAAATGADAPAATNLNRPVNAGTSGMAPTPHTPPTQPRSSAHAVVPSAAATLKRSRED